MYQQVTLYARIITLVVICIELFTWVTYTYGSVWDPDHQ